MKKVTEFIKLTIAQGGVNPKLVGTGIRPC